MDEELYGDIGQQDQSPETDGPPQDQTQAAFTPQNTPNPPAPQAPTPPSAPAAAPNPGSAAPQPQSPAPKGPVQWQDISDDGSFQKLPDDQKEVVRQKYFQQTIAADPDFQKLPADQQNIVKQKFDQQSTKTGLGDVTANAENIFTGDAPVTGPISGIIRGVGAVMRGLGGDEKPPGYPAMQSDTDAPGEKKVPEDPAIPLLMAGMTTSAAGNPLRGQTVTKSIGDAISDVAESDAARDNYVKVPGITPEVAAQSRKQLYAKADEAGGVAGGNLTTKWLNNVRKEIPQESSLVRNARGEGGVDSPTETLIKNLEQNKGQMASYQGLSDLDKFLGQEAHQAFKSGDNITGANISKINEMLLDEMGKAPNLPGNEYGTAARQAFTQELKLRQLENMQKFAANTKNPATSVQAQMRQLVKRESTKKTSAWHPDELAAADKTAKTGDVTDILQSTGNRLSVLLGHSLPGKVMNYAASKAARSMADKIQFGKADNVAKVVGDKVPSVYDLKGLIPRIQNGETISDEELANSVGQ